MRILKSLVLALTASISVLAANGCLISNSDVSPGTELALLQQFETQAVQRYCARISACCSELSYPFDEAGCEKLNGNDIVQFFNFQSFTGSHYDPAAGKRCLDSIETPELGCSAKGDYKSEDCQKVFVGTVPLGGKCSQYQGCASADGAATTCDLPPVDSEHPARESTGVCVLAAPPITHAHAKAGEPCSSSCTESGICTTLCSDGQTCSMDLPECYASDGLICSKANVCVAIGVAGDPCMGSFECGAGTYCSLDRWRCEPLLHAGDACEDGIQCDTQHCSGMCTPPPRAYPEFCLGHIPAPPHSAETGPAAN